ncbi:MAG: hypothetical protein M0P01_02100 [Treponema sp.]|nr:hypothetical protein [Treponema sp.]
MKRNIFIIIAFLVLFGQTFYAQTVNTDSYNTASVSIKFYDKTMYYPNSTDTNPVFVHISVKNNGSDTLRFKLADDRMFSLDFNAYTIKNTQLEQTDSLIRKRTTNQTVYFREISLENGEEYSFVENLKDYLIIGEPSIYYIELNFYPELYKSNKIKLVSNRLTLEVRPSPSVASSSIIPIKSDTAEILKPEEISPDKVVEQTITARQKSLWDQYFLYMDIESMIERTPAAKRKFRSVSADERQKMIETYKSDLMESRIDGDIVAVPEKFQIEKTVYSQTEGSVLVTEWFNNRTYYEKKSYTYEVRQRDGVWQIYDYTVVNLGTE